MKPLLRVLWLLLGLIYRLIVLVLFERWIPFPERPPAGPPGADAPRTQRKARGARGQIAAPRAQQRQVPHGQPGARALPRPAIFESSLARPRARFDPRVLEPAPERVVELEGQHLAARAERSRSTAQARIASGRPLRALLRDKRALASAIVLGEAFAGRRTTRG
jgi:hypothetical protein